MASRAARFGNTMFADMTVNSVVMSQGIIPQSITVTLDESAIMEQENKTRIDKWLWAARFYKTRSLASEAINGGHVHLNGQRIKPSREVKTGDQLVINKPPYSFEITVRGLSARRGSAPQAQQLYEESETSLNRRQQLSEELRILRAAMPSADRRPDKRDRRRIIQFRNKHNEG